jgi:hypothetical protein
MLRALFLIATSMAVVMPCGDIEHLYGPGGQLVDDADLQARNQRAWEHMQAENQLAISRQQVKVELGYLRLDKAIARMGNYGGWFIGPPRRRAKDTSLAEADVDQRHCPEPFGADSQLIVL